jgi:creatinine amidohydrolase/Fe(II)-dependent formamide hydrolase-like protein
MGRPELATAAKGESLMNAIVEEVTAFIREFATWPELAELRASSLL